MPFLTPGACRDCGGPTWGRCKFCTPCSHKRARASFLRTQYGMTESDYEQMYREQEGLCAICKNPRRRRRLFVDHDHQTGRVRGLLCPTCNGGLGKLGDSEEGLLRALAYLRANS
jgi:hypothetical protein